MLPLAPQRLAEWIVGFATLGIALLALAATHAVADRMATQARESTAAIRAALVSLGYLAVRTRPVSPPYNSPLRDRIR